jgi:cytoskeletal protein CcmA (bactofilin family)
MSDKDGLPTGKHTLVEEGTEFTGKLSSNCPIVVMGKVEGEVAGPVIHVTKSGSVAGTVKVKELHSSGEIAGEVHADAVKISGRVRDKTVIKAKSIDVNLSADGGTMQVVFGECELQVGDEPNKDAAIAAASSTKPGAPESAQTRRRGNSEMWEDQTATSAKKDDEAEGGGKRRHKTLPPPMS